MANDTKLNNKEIAEILVQNYDIKPNLEEISSRLKEEIKY